MRTDDTGVAVAQERLAGRDGPIRVLVVGGSQGRRSWFRNDAAGCRRTGRYPVTIWHQSGKGAQLTVRTGICRGGTAGIR
ncbi:hypothetical protein KCP73_07490 [Salmonella enterica subsp. enterica]|nr:hypothetical protein KCP73_07490 [Salmonella enterica subsp. enterica]